MALLSTYRGGGGGGGTTVDSGAPIQIQNTLYVNRSAHIGTSTTSLASTGLSATITPTSATNEIIIEVTGNMTYGRSAGATKWALYRSGTGVTDGYIVSSTNSYPYYYGFLYRKGDAWDAQTSMFKDTTYDTTSALTYTLYHHQHNATSAGYTSHQGAPINMKLTEISA
jgi:hypothetical protein